MDPPPEQPTESAQGTLYYAPVLNGYSEGDEREVTDDIQTANLRSSLRKDGLHNVQLDLDGPHTYVPSSNKGHGHLTVETGVPWEDYEELLRSLAKCKVIDRHYLNFALERKATFLRLPHIKKTFGVDPNLEARRGLLELSHFGDQDST